MSGNVIEPCTNLNSVDVESVSVVSIKVAVGVNKLLRYKERAYTVMKIVAAMGCLASMPKSLLNARFPAATLAPGKVCSPVQIHDASRRTAGSEAGETGDGPACRAISVAVELR